MTDKEREIVIKTMYLIRSRKISISMTNEDIIKELKTYNFNNLPIIG